MNQPLKAESFENTLQQVKLRFEKIADAISKVILGKPEQIKLSLCCILAGGHLLLEDMPGMGKTTLAQALSKVLGLDYNRIQFTSDMLPADVLGLSVFKKQSETFEFTPGPIFTQLLMADEINRASPKTQSALLEAMEEHQVSVDGQTLALPKPFFVIATQNPSEQSGVYPLPESQLDRFLMRLSLGFADGAAEREMLQGQNPRDRIANLSALLKASEFEVLSQLVDRVYLAEATMEYLLRLVHATRTGSHGLSTRALLALSRAAKAHALMQGFAEVTPEDVQAVFVAVADHRLIGRPQQQKAADLLSTTPVIS